MCMAPVVNRYDQTLRRIRPNTRSVTGYYMSRMETPFAYESWLEYDHLLLCDDNPTIEKIIPQSPRIGRHVLDATLLRSIAPNYVVDVKYELELVRNWPAWFPLFSTTHNECRDNGFVYAFFTDATRNELRNRLAILRLVNDRGRINQPDHRAAEEILSPLHETTSAKVRTLTAKCSSKLAVSDRRSLVCKLLFDHRLSIVETPTLHLDDATVSLKSSNVGTLNFLIPFEKLLKRIETHPLRYMGKEGGNYRNGQKDIEFSGHKYEILDDTIPESILIKSLESGEEYRVSADTYYTPGGRLSAYALQQRDPEEYVKFIERLEIIGGLVRLGRMPSSLGSDVGEYLRLSTRQVERLVRSYREHGPSGLLPSETRGGKGKHRIHPRVDELMSKTIETHYLTLQKKSKVATYNHLTQAIAQINKVLPEKDHLEFPNLKTFYNRINEIEPRAKAQAREGSQAAENRFSTFGSKSTLGQRPLETVMVDHTPGDVILVDAETRQSVGRPFVMPMIDVYSHMLAGFYFSLARPSAYLVGIALLMCAMPKDEIALKHGIEWPVHGIPAGLHFDNAKEFTANLILAGCAAWGIQIIHRPLRNPRFGGLVERVIGTLQREFIHTLPGTTKSSVKERGEYHSEKEACLTQDEFETFFVKSIDQYHHTPQKELGGMTPLEKWQHGVEEYGMPRQLDLEDQQKFRLDFLPAEDRTIQKDGVHFAGLTYYSDKLARFSREDNRGNSLAHAIKYDPWDIRHIWILDTKEKVHYRIPSTTIYHEPIPLTRWEISRRNLAKRGIRGPSASIVFSQYEESQAIVENAVSLTKKVRKETEIARRNREIADEFKITQTNEPKLSMETDGDEYQPPAKNQHAKIRTSFHSKEC